MSLVSFFIFGEVIDKNETEEKNGIVYKIGEKKPYTGITTGYDEYVIDNKFKIEINYKDGKKNGISRWYNKNGVLEYEDNYKDGKAEGIAIGYYESGAHRCERNYKDDKLD
jgi:antitoxin component YwqK of YwqJK toxin-antitoxin module